MQQFKSLISTLIEKQNIIAQERHAINEERIQYEASIKKHKETIQQ